MAFGKREDFFLPVVKLFYHIFFSTAFAPVQQSYMHSVAVRNIYKIYFGFLGRPIFQCCFSRTTVAKPKWIFYENFVFFLFVLFCFVCHMTIFCYITRLR